MLSLGIKHGEKLNLYDPIHMFISKVSGTQIASRMGAPLKNFQQIRDELVQITSLRGDNVTLETLIENANMYISILACIASILPFGIGKVLFILYLRKLLMFSLFGMIPI